MPLMSWQLWLARDLIEEHHLPWQSSQKHLTSGRVAQSLFSLLIEIDGDYTWRGNLAMCNHRVGTPTSSPKTRGKSPGWQTGRKRSKKRTYPIAKKSYSRPKKSENKIA